MKSFKEIENQLQNTLIHHMYSKMVDMWLYEYLDTKNDNLIKRAAEHLSISFEELKFYMDERCKNGTN